MNIVRRMSNKKTADHPNMNNHNNNDICRNEINLSIQYILNCASSVAGSCHGGSASGVYEYIKLHSGYIPYDTCMSYVACSSDSTNGFCPHIDTSCSPMNICRTCDSTGKCYAITEFPNATIAEYGTYSYYSNFNYNDKIIHQIKSEIYTRGPVAAAINANPLLNYKGGIINETSILHMFVNHVVSIVGWGYDHQTQVSYWIVRNSWGTYWGEMSYFRIIMGHNSLGIESDVVWATPLTFTIHNVPCRTTTTIANYGNNSSNNHCQPMEHDNNNDNNGVFDLKNGKSRMIGNMNKNNWRSHYYIDPSNFDPNVLSLKLQRQRT
jgi:cathepsin X